MTTINTAIKNALRAARCDDPHPPPISDQQIVRIKSVEALTQLSRMTIYHLIKAGKFPPSIQLSEKARGWRLREIEEYLATRSAPDSTSWRPSTGRSIRKEANPKARQREVQS
ncbi:MAG: helix-turn-helix transcriptional regulator [Steroidobacteraceae bacterium]